jgi:hypothetical protein
MPSMCVCTRGCIFFLFLSPCLCVWVALSRTPSLPPSLPHSDCVCAWAGAQQTFSLWNEELDVQLMAGFRMLNLTVWSKGKSKGTSGAARIATAYTVCMYVYVCMYVCVYVCKRHKERQTRP